MTDFDRKRAAVLRAEDEITRALKNVAQVFKNFREDYLALLLDHEQNLEILQQYRKNGEKNVPLRSENSLPEIVNILKVSERLNLEPEGKTEKSQDSNSTQDSYFPETLGVVENTQFPKPKSNERTLRNCITNTRKNIFSSRSSANNENQIPPSAFDISVNSQSSSQNSGKLSLSKVHAGMQISTSGKVSRQTKLVLQAVNIKTDVSNNGGSMKKSVPSTSRDCIDPADLDIDITLFEKPFSMEQELDFETQSAGAKKKVTRDIIEFSPTTGSLKKKGRLALKQKPPRKNSTEKEHDTAIISDVNIEEFDQWSTQASISPSRSITKPLIRIERNSLSPLLDGRDDSTEISPENVSTDKSRILVDDFNIFFDDSQSFREPEQLKGTEKTRISNLSLKVPKTCSQDSTLSDDMDETYFSPVEGILASKKSEASSIDPPSMSKRKFEDMAGSSKGKEGECDQKKVVDEIDVGDDWNTDSSLDEGQSTPPNKKLLMNSFDVIPKKKKTSPNYAYKGPVVRKKSERAKLRGWDCRDCEKWYENMDLSEKELEMRKNQCSRHRSKYNERYYTPPGFWNPVFSSDESCSQD